MPIQFRCPHCRTKLSVSRKRAGNEIDCPSCLGTIQVPAIASSSSTGDQEEGDVSTNAPLQSANQNEDKNAGQEAAGDNLDLDLENPFEEAGSSSAEGATEDLFEENDLPAATIVSRPKTEEDDEEFAIRKADTEFEEMDLTPMVDVTFLLLIFFMITASFNLQKTMQFPPPQPDEDGATTQIVEQDEAEDTAIIIEVDENNTITIGEDLETVADPAMLPEKISEYARTQETQEIMLTAHDRALHDTVVWVLDSAREAGIQRIRIGTRSE